MKYRVQVEYSTEDAGYIATAPELPGCSAFGTTPEEAVREIQVAGAAWLETARDLGREIPEPSSTRNYSGRFLLRMPPELHRSIEELATDAAVSINQYLVYLLARAVGAASAKQLRDANPSAITRSRTRRVR